MKTGGARLKCRNEVFYVPQDCDCKRSQSCIVQAALRSLRHTEVVSDVYEPVFTSGKHRLGGSFPAILR